MIKRSKIRGQEEFYYSSHCAVIELFNSVAGKGAHASLNVCFTLFEVIKVQPLSQLPKES